MKQPRLLLLAVLLVTPLLTQCLVVDENGNAVTTTPSFPTPNVSASAPAYGQPLTSVNGLGSVTIREGSRTVSSIRTAFPNIEQTRFINEQEQIVVKSRGNHGPATVQLFNSRTGRQEGTVMAYELANGGPSWAAGMAD